MQDVVCLQHYIPDSRESLMLQVPETNPELLTQFFATYHEYGIYAVHHLIAAAFLYHGPSSDETICSQIEVKLSQQLQHLFNFLSSPNIAHTLSCAQIPATLKVLAVHHPQLGHVLFSAANPPTQYDPLSDLSNDDFLGPLGAAPVPHLEPFGWDLLYTYTPNIKTRPNGNKDGAALVEQKWVHHTAGSDYLSLVWTPTLPVYPILPSVLSATLFHRPTGDSLSTVLFGDRCRYTHTTLTLDRIALQNWLPDSSELVAIPSACFPLRCVVHLDLNHEYLMDNPLSLTFVCHTANATPYAFALRSRVSILPEHRGVCLNLTVETNKTILNRLRYFVLALHQFCVIQQWLQPFSMTLKPAPFHSPSHPRWHLQSTTTGAAYAEHSVKWDPSSHYLTSSFCGPIPPHDDLGPLRSPLLTMAQAIQLNFVTC